MMDGACVGRKAPEPTFGTGREKSLVARSNRRLFPEVGTRLGIQRGRGKGICAPPAASAALAATRKNFGTIPNLERVIASAPPAVSS
jgi:hypothetical protein